MRLHARSVLGEAILTSQMAPKRVRFGSAADHRRLDEMVTCRDTPTPFALFLQALLDHKVYYLNITDTNLTNKPKWQVEYSAKVSPTNHCESSDHVIM